MRAFLDNFIARLLGQVATHINQDEACLMQTMANVVYVQKAETRLKHRSNMELRQFNFGCSYNV